MDSTSKNILKWVEHHESSLHEILSDLVSFQSTNPYDIQGELAQNYIASKLESMNFKVDRFEAPYGVENILAEISNKPSKLSLLLTGHVDVVPANNENWLTPPFTAKIKGKKMFGRGTSDMKGSLAGFLLALEAVLSVAPKSIGKVIFASVFGEEIANSGSKYLAQKIAKPTFAILGEPSRSASINASVGLLNLHLTLKDNQKLHLAARRNYMRAGGGLLGGNCIEKMANHIIPGLQELERSWGVTKIENNLPVGQALISPYGIKSQGNIADNPNSCQLDLAVVFLPSEQERDVRHEIESHIASIVGCDYWLKMNPPICTWDPPVYLPAEVPEGAEPMNLLCDVYEKVTDKKIKIGERGAITDAGWFFKEGIPTVIFGAGDISSAHGADEFINLDDLLTFTKVVAAYIYQIGEQS